MGIAFRYARSGLCRSMVQAEIAKLAARVGEDSGSAPKLQLKSLNLAKPSSAKTATIEKEHKATAEG